MMAAALRMELWFEITLNLLSREIMKEKQFEQIWRNYSKSVPSCP